MTCEHCGKAPANCTLHYFFSDDEEVCEDCFQKELDKRYGKGIDIEQFVTDNKVAA